MNCKTQVALGAGIGYLLGRQHKLRWGLLLAAAAASGRLSRPGALLEHGARALSSTPELGKLGELGAPLVAATKDAARAAVSGRIASVTDRLQERSDMLRQPRKEREPEDEPRERPEGRARAQDREPEEEEPERPARRRQAAEYEPERDNEEAYDSSGERGNGRSARQGARRPQPPTEDYEGAGDEEDDREPLPARTRPGGRPPVRRREG
jgi:hypothetical protein